MGPLPSRPPKVQLLPSLLPTGDDPHGGGLRVDHADGHFVGDDAGDDLGAGVPGMRSCPGPRCNTAVMASSLVRVRQPAEGGLDHAGVSVTGIKAPESPPTLELAMTPPLFFTASLSSAKAAVVPWAPHCSRPMPSKM